MARINARSKGAAGERELAEWLFYAFKLKEKPQRNIEQVRSGGADLIVPPFAFECKRVENLNLINWWSQVTAAVKEPGPAFGLEPVVAFRQNRQKWEFLISASHIGVDTGFIRLSEACFKKWVPVYIERNFGTRNTALEFDMRLLCE